jgi:sterol desaturase/sphingolipid hydroxylase (fatty acid hydroxylase superfamily)
VSEGSWRDSLYDVMVATIVWGALLLPALLIMWLSPSLADEIARVACRYAPVIFLVLYIAALIWDHYYIKSGKAPGTPQQ